MMETERGSQKHRCKHCRKSFPSGRSLGGHMRCHAPAPAAPVAPAASVTTSTASEPDSDKPQSSRSVVVGFSPAYGLRENPKKTWRISADDVPGHGGSGDKSCRECGKRFASWKSLFGHMRSHSLKQLSTIEQEEEEDEEQQQHEQQSKVEEEGEEEEASRSRSDTVFGNVHVPRKRRRSRRAIASCSISASEEYEKEDEEGAITLLMLSRDVRCWSGGGGGGGLIQCVQESSDNNSVVVENKRVDLASDESEEAKKAKRTRGSQLGDLRSGRRSRGINKVEESDASDNGLIGDRGFEQFEDSRKDPSSNSASEFGIKREGSEVEASLHDAFNGDFDDGKLAAERRRRKSRSFECVDCDKAFHSYQALGGHRASHHKRIDQNADLKAGRGGSRKKSGDHECLICGRSFASGQALGGHKKSHLGLIQQQKLPEKPDELLDLNIPASTTEGDCVSTNNGVDSELNSWWIGGSSMQHEPLVGVISN